MSYKVAIRKNGTGEVRTYQMDGRMEWEHEYEDENLRFYSGSMYWWAEGNASCDCNRCDFFADAGGESRENAKCSDDRFTVLYAELPDGLRVQNLKAQADSLEEILIQLQEER